MISEKEYNLIPTTKIIKVGDEKVQISYNFYTGKEDNGFYFAEVNPEGECDIKKFSAEGEIVVENPTSEQLQYALLNLIIEDNYSNVNKRGYYQKGEEFLFEEYTKILKEAEDEAKAEKESVGVENILDNKDFKITPSLIFNKFAIVPKTSADPALYNGIIRSVLADIQGRDKNAYEYVIREVPKFDEKKYEADKSGIYTIEASNENNGYKIVKISDGDKKEIKKATKDQLKNALMNVVIKDHFTNLNKTGLYNKLTGDLDIDSCFQFAINKKIKNGQEFLRLFALKLDDKTANAIKNAVNDIVEPTAEKEL